MRGRFEDPIFAVKKRRGAWIVWLAVLVIVLSIAFILNLMNNQRIEVETVSVTVPDIPSAFNGYKILHISDLHGASFGSQQSGFAAAISDLKYNMVCITGDVTDESGNFTAFTDLLRCIPEGIPVYFISGDEDPLAIISVSHAVNNHKAEYVLAAEKLGAVYLDAPVCIQSGSAKLWVVPGSYYTTDIQVSRHSLQAYQETLQGDDADNEAALRVVQYRLGVLDKMEEAQLAMLSGDVNITLTHFPFTASSVASLPDTDTADDFSNISVILAGHYNNGQFRLPLIGPVFVPESISSVANGTYSGLQSLRGIQQYISPGLGVSGEYPLRARFCNTPTVTLVTLTNKLTK